MKKLFQRFKLGLLTALTLLFTAGLASANVQTTDIAPTWHNDITTAKHSVEFYGGVGVNATGSRNYTIKLSGPGFLTRLGLVTKITALSAIETFGGNVGAISYADAPDLAAIATGFFEKGPTLFMKHVNEWNLTESGITVYKAVKAPIVLPKLSAKGGPRPYRVNDDSSGNGFKFGDRTLTVHQSKWDYLFSPEEFRNTYLNDGTDKPYYELALGQVSKEYLGAINDSVMGSGVYNASGTSAVAIADGYLTIIAAEITATNITPVVTGAITSSNALAKVELVATAMPSWMRAMPTKILCSYDIFDKYKADYRTKNAFGFQPRDGKYYLDGFANCVLTPVSWLGTSQRLIATIDGNLILGTDADSITVHPSVKFDQIETRLKFPVGLQIADLEALIVNDQA